MPDARHLDEMPVERPTVFLRDGSSSRKDLLATLVTIATLAPRRLVVDKKAAAGILLSQEDCDSLAQVGAEALGALIALEYSIKPVRHSLLERRHHVHRRVRNDDAVDVFGREVCRCARQELSAGRMPEQDGGHVGTSSPSAGPSDQITEHRLGPCAFGLDTVITINAGPLVAPVRKPLPI